MEVNILNFFSEAEIEEIAKNAGLVERKSPITGFKFMLAFSAGFMNTPDGTLNQLAAFLNSTCGISISPQSLDARINSMSSKFLKLCLQKAMALSMKPLEIDNEFLAFFSHIYIIDSTNFDLHPALRDMFKGSAGSASKASMRIQFVYDYLTGQMYVEIGDTDNSDAGTLHDIIQNCRLETNGNTLFLSDLGYFKKDTFLMINKNPEQFFISKLRHKICIQNMDGREIDLMNIIKKGLDNIDIKIKMGDLECRLLGQKLPENIVEQKWRKANKANKDRGRIVSDEYKAFLSYAFFITNLPENYTFNVLYTLYRIRWQIELIFKTWKSILNIHKIHSARTSRVLCEVYGKLIIASISNILYLRVQADFDCNLSYHKVLKHIKAVVIYWALSIIDGKNAHEKFIRNLAVQIVRLCRKNKQEKKPTIELLLQNLTSEKYLRLKTS